MKDDLGDRMKNQYEDRTRYSLPRRTYTIIRLDGKAFHTFTRNMQRPFDYNLMTALLQAAGALCSEAMGTAFAYLQSDEMSFLLTDFSKPSTEAWFDGNIQKICSVSASVVTAAFNAEDYICRGPFGQARFDARVFTIPDPVEVENYFIWRQNDCMRNSINMVAQSVFSHKELQGKSCDEIQEMLFTQKGINWNECPDQVKRGRILRKEEYYAGSDEPRTRWACVYPPVFTRDRSFLRNLIPVKTLEAINEVDGA